MRMHILVFVTRTVLQNAVSLGQSPGLVVKEVVSLSEGCESESQRHILDGHFSHWFVVKL